MNLKLEVPDPNLCDSLRLMIKLLEEDRKAVEVGHHSLSMSGVILTAFVEKVHTS